MKRLLFVIALLLVFCFVLVPSCMAQDDPVPVPGPIEPEVPGFVDLVDKFAWDLMALFPSVAEVVGWGLLVGAVIDVLKWFGIVPDAWSARIALLSNAVLWVILWFAGALHCEEEVRAIIEHLGTALPVLVSLATMLGVSKLAHWFMTKIDAKSFSFSAGLVPLLAFWKRI